MSEGRIQTFLIGTFVVTTALVFGCSTSGTSNNDRANVNTTPNLTADSGPSASPTPAVDANLGTQKRRKDAVANVPTPRIGSGGDDLSMFSQIRAALGAEGDFTNVIIDVKSGSVNLSGKVRTAAQKSTAARLAAGVKGVTGVKNNLQVAP